MIRYEMIRCDMIWYDLMLYDAILYHIKYHISYQIEMIQYCIIQHQIISYHIISYYFESYYFESNLIVLVNLTIIVIVILHKLTEKFFFMMISVFHLWFRLLHSRVTVNDYLFPINFIYNSISQFQLLTRSRFKVQGLWIKQFCIFSPSLRKKTIMCDFSNTKNEWVFRFHFI